GVNVALQTMEWGAFLAKLRTKEQEMFALSWMAGAEDPDLVMYPLLHSSQWTPNGPNRAMYRNARFDELLSQARAITDPANPAEIMLGPQATHEDITRLRTELGLDEPLAVQYARWMGRVLQGDLGRSLWMKRPVLGEVLRRFQATVVLAASALLLSTLGGIALGVLSAARRNSLLDRLSALASLFGASMPSFWLGIVLMVKIGRA